MIPTKTIKFDAATLTLLRQMEWSDDGLQGKITQQLDRKSYEGLNKALEAMGGSWNRKAKAHVFQADPRQAVEGLLESGSIKVERDGFFETPAEIVNQMIALARIEPGLVVLEPSAGRGSIAFALRKAGAYVSCVEQNNERAAYLAESFADTLCGDFMNVIGNPMFDRVVMNPPFENQQDIDHVRHAFDFLKPGGRLVSIMSAGITFRHDKKVGEFLGWLDSMAGEITILPEGAFKSSGTGVNAVMICVDKPGR